MTRSKLAAIIVAFGALCAFSGMASAKTCEVTIEGNDQMRFNKDRIDIAADCTEVKLTLKHVGKLPAAAMGHNWVLTQTSDFSAVEKAGASAGLQNNYVPANDKRVIAHTKVIGCGETTSVTFSTSLLKQGGDYMFFCSFPGHAALMKGKLNFGG